MAVPTWSQALPDPGFYAKESLNRALTAQTDMATKEKELEYKQKEEMWKKAQTPLTEDAVREMFAARWGDSVADNRIKDLHTVGAFRNVNGLKYTTPFDIEIWNKMWSGDEKFMQERMLRDIPLMIEHETGRMQKSQEDLAKLKEKKALDAADYGGGGLVDEEGYAKKEAPLQDQFKKSQDSLRNLVQRYILMNPQGAHQAGMNIMPQQKVDKDAYSLMPGSPDVLSGKKEPQWGQVPDATTGRASAQTQVSGATKYMLESTLSTFLAQTVAGANPGTLKELMAPFEGFDAKTFNESGGNINSLTAKIQTSLLNSQISVPANVLAMANSVGIKDVAAIREMYAHHAARAIADAIYQTSLNNSYANALNQTNVMIRNGEVIEEMRYKLVNPESVFKSYTERRDASLIGGQPASDYEGVPTSGWGGNKLSPATRPTAPKPGQAPPKPTPSQIIDKDKQFELNIYGP